MDTAKGASPWATFDQVIDGKVEERTEALRRENSEWRRATYEELETSIASFAKKGKEVKALRLDVGEIQATQQRLQVEQLKRDSAVRPDGVTAAALTEAKQEIDLLKSTVSGMLRDYRELAIHMQSLEGEQQSTRITVRTADDGSSIISMPALAVGLNSLTKAQEYPPTGLARIAQQVLSSESSLPRPAQAGTATKCPSLEAASDDALHGANPGYERERKRQKSAPASGTSCTLRGDSHPVSSSSDYPAKSNQRSSSVGDCIEVAQSRRDMSSNMERARDDSPEEPRTADAASANAAINALSRAHNHTGSLQPTGQSNLLEQWKARPGRVSKEDMAAENSALTSVEETAVAFGKGSQRRTVARPRRYTEHDPSTVNAAGRKGRAGSIKRKYPDDEFMMVEEEDPEALELQQQQRKEARDARASRRM
ncbi:hypothetical protein LTR91_008650 [Friedmanniomyces endolithicus]|uniref:Uncharacterized protein n=1 Tax=Friedmanniomyces endolithicus TaxID=329885 RepID=A0AAN6QUS4_9PEZI|nr:hypothetical protein LTR57_017921 [Friedmanniomyces endolithicus]KAK0967642.1 hypothetical protein LTS01_017161 [Friedmanniomyces endolithicus]KAK0991235.1 hypothetical protein LTR91_008650 [Friedmanniomyces endolithicus]KAK1038317.1 hypothetical protein LTS16_012144 [Friedmanniomyces endolithicus]